VPTSSVAVLLPVKAFGDAKARLADALTPAERIVLARTMAEVVAKAAQSHPTWVVCDDRDVAQWAHQNGLEVLWKPGRGLNGAVTEGVADLAHLDFARVIVSHADLPHAQNFDVVLANEQNEVVIVPDRHNDGTNVICLPASSGFVFSYGPGSFNRHQLEAQRLGLPLRIERDERLGWDIDRPDDLEPPPWA